MRLISKRISGRFYFSPIGHLNHELYYEPHENAGVSMGFNNITYLLPLAFNLIGKPASEHTHPTLGFALLTHTTHVDTLPETDKPQVAHCGSFLGMHFNLGTAVQYKGHDTSGTILANQFSLFYLPVADIEYKLNKGIYRSLSIHFPPAYLELMEPHFPLLLTHLLKDADLDVASTASAGHHDCTIEMLTIINNVLHAEGLRGVCRDNYLNSIVFDLLLRGLELITKHLKEPPSRKRTSRLLSTDLQKVKQASEYLQQHLQDPFDSNQLAEKLGMEVYKLRMRFKAHYKTTMMNFLIELRMTKARDMLQNSTLPIKEIAFSIGYVRASLFTAFFTKKYGYPPSSLRIQPV